APNRYAAPFNDSCVCRRRSIANDFKLPLRGEEMHNDSINRRDFLKTASLATLGATAFSQLTRAQTKGEQNVKGLDIVFYLYPGMTALDAIGTYEVMRAMPGATVKFAAKERGAVRMDSQMLTLQADFAIREIEAADILVLPGGGTTVREI